MVSTPYRENHYVAQWYQRRFLPATGEQKFRCLDLKPERFRDPNGVTRQKKALNRWGTDRCFKQTDLYTTRFGAWQSTEIEQFFFGRVDTRARAAIEYFANFAHPGANDRALNDLLNYMSVQKLRTPKGLAHLAAMTGMSDSNAVLLEMQRIQNRYCATWTEAVWALVDARQTRTKFILSDHPVTVYNRDCFPGSDWCRDFRDPDIRFVGTHTIFPLSPTRTLVLTNHSWVRNPYVRATKTRPNPQLFRTTVFYFPSIQTGRELTEVEVNQINFIIKKRAYRYIAAADEAWLYPERHIPSEHWRKLDDLYLLMPDPRSVRVSEQIIIGYDNRPADIFDAYGRRPGQPGFKDDTHAAQERRTHLGFQGEYARLFGPKRRGIGHDIGGRERSEDSPEFHQWHLSLERKFGRTYARKKRNPPNPIARVIQAAPRRFSTRLFYPSFALERRTPRRAPLCKGVNLQNRHLCDFDFDEGHASELTY